MRYRLIISWFLIVLSGLIIFASIGIYSVVNLIPRYEQRIKLIISKRLGATVDFKINKIQWIGLEPVINIRDIVIDNPKKDYSAYLSHVVVKLNLIDSLISWKPSAEAVEVDKLYIKLKLKQGSVGANKAEGSLTQQKAIALTIGWLHLLTNQRRLVFKNAVLDLETKKQNIIIPFVIEWNKVGSSQYRLLIKAKIKEASKSNIKLLVNINSSFLSGISAVGELDLNLNNIGDYASNFVDSRYSLKQGDISAQLKFKIKDNNFEGITSHINITNLYLDSQNQLEQPIHLSNLATNLKYQLSDKVWGLEFDNLFVGISGYSNEIKKLNIYGKTNTQISNRIKINLSNLDLSFMNNTYHLFTAFFGRDMPKITYLQDIDLFGRLEKTNAFIDYTNTTVLNWGVESHWDDIGFNNYKSKLSVKNISGQIYASKNTGWVLIDSPKLKFNGEDILENPVPAVKVKTFVEWNRTNKVWHIKFNDLGFTDTDLSVKAFGSVSIPEENPSKTLVNIYGFISGVDIGQRFKHFLPKLGMAPELYTWLTESITVVEQASGFFLIDGPIMQMPFQHNQGQFTVGANVIRSSFYPYYKWPLIDNVDARLWFHNQKVEILTTQGSSEGASVKYGSFVIPNIAPGTPSFMQINGEIQAVNNQANTYIKKSPLMESVGSLVQNIDYQGKVNVSLSLRFPLGDPSNENEIEGVVKVYGGTAKIKKLGVNIYDLNGAVAFENSKYTIKTLTGQFYPFAPLSVKLESQKISKDNYIYTGSLKAILPLEIFTKDLPSGIKGNISGYMPINVNFEASNVKGGKINFNTSLLDVESNFPAPMRIDHGSLTPLYGQIGWDSNFDIFHGKIHFKDNIILSLNIDKHQKNKTPLIASLSIPELNISQWFNFLNPSTEFLQPISFQDGALKNWQQYQFKPMVSVFSSKWYYPNMMPNVNYLIKNIVGDFQPYLHINVGLLSVYGYKFNDFIIDSNTSAQIINITLSSQEKGKLNIAIPLDGYKPWGVGLNSIEISDKDKNVTLVDTKKSQGMNIPKIDANMLSLIPPMHVLIKNLTVFDRSVHDSTFNLEPLYGGISIPVFIIKDMGDSLIMGDVSFYGSPLQADFSVKATSNDWGQLLDFYGYKDILKGGNGPITAQLNWQGSYIPEISKVSGKVMFNIQDGVIEKVKPGLAKLIGIFSINTYLSRLTTIYSDFTTAGMMFNKIMGKYLLTDGVAYIDSKIYISTPSFDAIIKGYINFKENKIAQTATLQPHLSGMFAIVAGVLGGPIVGVATYLIEELIANTLLKNSGLITLHINGDLTDPVVTKKAL